MPRPANPGWRPRTVTLSNEVIEAVWVKAAREGTTPGRVINEILARILLQSAPVPEESPAQADSSVPPSTEQMATVHSSNVTTGKLPPQAGETPPEKRAIARPAEPPEPIDPEHLALLKVLQEPLPDGYDAYPVVLQKLSKRFRRDFGARDFAWWNEQSRIPKILVPAIKEILEELLKPKEPEKTRRRR